jgi:hypothetical protein
MLQMANLSQTAANVAVGALDARIAIFTAGESITQGMPVYLSSTDGKYYQCDSNDGAAKAEAKGIALTAAATNGFFVLGSKGKINLGATLTVGEVYTVSRTKGAICPISDLTSADYVTILGIATTTALIELNVQISGVLKP